MKPSEIQTAFATGSYADLDIATVRALDRALAAARDSARAEMANARGHRNLALIQGDDKALSEAEKKIARHEREIERAEARRAQLEHRFALERVTDPEFGKHAHHHRPA